MKGITLATYRRYRPDATEEQLRAISDEEVERIYRDGYWEPVRGDDLPPGLDLVAFDAAVNSGVSRGAKWLQKALGAPEDGMIGPETLEAAKTADRLLVINSACIYRLNFLRSLSHWDTFGRGWQRRVDSVREVAQRMAK